MAHLLFSLPVTCCLGQDSKHSVLGALRAKHSNAPTGIDERRQTERIDFAAVDSPAQSMHSKGALILSNASAGYAILYQMVSKVDNYAQLWYNTFGHVMEAICAVARRFCGVFALSNPSL